MSILDNKLEDNYFSKKIEHLEKLLKEKRAFYLLIKRFNRLNKEDRVLLFKITPNTKYTIVKNRDYVKVCFFIENKVLPYLDNSNIQNWKIII